MYDISIDNVQNILFPGTLNQSSVQEGENRVHMFTVEHFFEDSRHMDYLWPIFKLPSGAVKIGDLITLVAADYTEDSVTFLVPDSLLTEHGNYKIQIFVTDSTDDILAIVDAFSQETFTGKIAKSIVYDFYVNDSIDPILELIPQPGSLSDAAKEYIENLVDEIIAEGVDLSSKADKNNTEITGSLSMYRWAGTTRGNKSTALGDENEASGYGSFAQGHHTAAKGQYSHAEGGRTIASSVHQHVEGKFNVEDANDEYAHIVGNGSADNARSNAHTLDWSGNAWFASDVKIGGSGFSDPVAIPLGTLRLVSNYSKNVSFSVGSGSHLADSNGQHSFTEYVSALNGTAPADLISAITSGKSLFLDVSGRGRYPLSAYISFGSGSSVNGYFLTYNATVADYANKVFNKIDDNLDIIAITIGVIASDANMDYIYASFNGTDVDISILAYGTPAMLEEIPNSIQVDSSLDANSQHPVENRTVKAALDQKVNKTDVESALSSSSSNPVKNKVIKAALDLKGDLREVTFYESSVDVAAASDNTYLSDSSGNEINNYCDLRLPPVSQYLVDAIQEGKRLYINFASTSEVLGVTEKYDTTDPTLIVGYYILYNAEINTSGTVGRSLKWKKHLNGEPIIVMEISTTDLSVVSLYTSMDTLHDISITGYGTPAMLEELDEIVVTGTAPLNMQADGYYSEVQNLNYTAKEICEAYSAGKRIRGLFSFQALGAIPVEFVLGYVEFGVDELDPSQHYYNANFFGFGLPVGMGDSTSIKVQEIILQGTNTTGTVRNAVVPQASRLLPLISGESDRGKIPYVSYHNSRGYYWAIGSVSSVIGSYVESQIKEYVSVYVTSVELVRSAADDYIFDSEGGTINNYSDDTLSSATSWLKDYAPNKTLYLFINGNEYELTRRNKTDGWYLYYNGWYRSAEGVWRKDDDSLPIYVIDITDSTNTVTIASSEEFTGTFTIKVYGGTHTYKEELDTTPTLNSKNAVTSGGVASRLSTLSALLNGKQNTLVSGQNMDADPTTGSNKPVTSGGVYKAIIGTEGTFTKHNGLLNVRKANVRQIGNIVFLSLWVDRGTTPFGTSRIEIGTISGVGDVSGATAATCLTMPDHTFSTLHNAAMWMTTVSGATHVYLQASDASDTHVLINTFYYVA